MNLTLLAYLNLGVAAWLGWNVFGAIRHKAVYFSQLKFTKDSDPAGFWFVTALYSAFMVMALLLSLDILTNWVFL